MDITTSIERIFQDRVDNTPIQLFRYTIVGGVSFCVDFIFLFFLTEFIHFHYLISAVVAFLSGLVVNYFLSVAWVFHSHSLKNRGFEILLFTIVGIIGLGFNELFIWFFTDLVHIYYLLSKVLSTILVYLWNFFARKYLLYNPKRKNSEL